MANQDNSNNNDPESSFNKKMLNSRTSKRQRNKIIVTKSLTQLYMGDPFYPHSRDEFWDRVLEMGSLCDEILDNITPIVTVSQYQNAISTAHMILNHGSDLLIHIISETECEVFDKEDIIVRTCDLVNCMTAGMRIFESMSYVQNAQHNINEVLLDFEIFVDRIQVLLCYIINEILNTTLAKFMTKHEAALKPYCIKGFSCVKCKKLVSFSGCKCKESSIRVTPEHQKLVIDPSEYDPFKFTDEAYSWGALMEKLRHQVLLEKLKQWNDEFNAKRAAKYVTLGTNTSYQSLAMSSDFDSKPTTSKDSSSKYLYDDIEDAGPSGIQKSRHFTYNDDSSDDF